MDVKVDWNEWYATVTAVQFSFCMFLFAYIQIQGDRSSQTVKLVRLYIGMQCLMWFLVNLSFIQVIGIDKTDWEIIESLMRLGFLLIFYYEEAPKAKYLNHVIVLIPLLVFLPLFIAHKTNDLTIIQFFRVLSGGVGLALSFTLLKYLHRELSVVSLMDYYLFWFNAGFFLRSGGILWFTMLIVLYTPVKTIDSTLLDVSFSILGLIEYLVLFLGIKKLESKNRYI
jgi:hypothetical protein